MRLRLSGKLDVQFVSGNHGLFLLKLSQNNIQIFDLKELGALAAQCRIRREDYVKFLHIASRTGTEVTVQRESGLNSLVKHVLHRWVLAVGVLTLVFCTVYFPSRILFVSVNGNCAIPTQKIIETAEICGIHFGASRKAVRSEKVKNALISVLPELQWVGVNTAGCVVEISVREKVVPDEGKQESHVSSIIAVTDGIIRELIVTKGNPLCRVGQAVKQGQVIISGYTDCGLLLIGTQAQGEVYGETKHNQTTVTPVVYSKRESLIEKNKKISLQIGKNIIKFYKDSGISDASCVKMYEKEYMVLPGGFQLPVALITETVTEHLFAEIIEDKPEAFDWLSKNATDYLLRQTVAGKLISLDENRTVADGICAIQGSYACYEMIGRIQSEESIIKNGSNG